VQQRRFGVERQSEALADLRYFHAVGEARAVKVTLPNAKNLGFALQAPKSRRVDDAGAIDLKR
jgi:hypothetical protein